MGIGRGDDLGPVTKNPATVQERGTTGDYYSEMRERGNGVSYQRVNTKVKGKVWSVTGKKEGGLRAVKKRKGRP